MKTQFQTLRMSKILQEDALMLYKGRRGISHVVYHPLTLSWLLCRQENPFKPRLSEKIGADHDCLICDIDSLISSYLSFSCCYFCIFSCFFASLSLSNSLCLTRSLLSAHLSQLRWLAGFLLEQIGKCGIFLYLIKKKRDWARVL